MATTVRAKDPLANAQMLPSGARFYKCALQVNPFEYIKVHGKQSRWKDEHEYNAAIIEACSRLGIEVIAVADHYRVRTSETLIAEAQRAGLHVFPGFEAVSKDGVHFLCLFDPRSEIGQLERILGDCGILQDHRGSPTGRYDAIELLSESRRWGAVCIAAHVASDGGLLRKLSGQSRIQAWRSTDLLAASLPGPVSEAPEDLRAMLANRNPDYQRDRSVAVLNAQDVSDPEALEEPGSTTWIKMSAVSIEGLRQAFVDHDSRIRLSSDPVPSEHAELVALTWEGGKFLDGAAIHFSSNLNVLIGGRGTGKTTIIESIRYVLGLEPVGEDARKAHQGIVQHVLRSGTKISALVRTCRPAQRDYRIERTVPNPPVVRDEAGEISTLLPDEVLPRVEVFGQHEISELTKSREKLTRLLDRFVESDEGLKRRKVDLRRELEKTRHSLVETRAEITQIEDRLAALPGLEEMLKRFQDAGLEERLKDQSLIVREERILDNIPERLEIFQEILENLKAELPIDRVFLSAKALADLPGSEILRNADHVLAKLSDELQSAAHAINGALDTADRELEDVRRQWGVRKRQVQSAYEKILRELQKSAIDGEEFIRLRRQIEALRPLRDRLALLRRNDKSQMDRRRSLLDEWENTKAEGFRLLDKAAKRVSKKLRDRVQVEVTAGGDREPVFRLMRSEVGGRLSEAIDTLAGLKDFSIPQFVDAARRSADALHKTFGLPPAQAERIAKATPETLMRVEELELPPTTAIRLNTAPAGAPPVWQTLEDLSTGQKATAVLLLLLLESDAPLIVDQPEDDLDNRFITEGVVPRMREEKRRRQFIFATHNANIPVLGDAELILGLSAIGDAEEGHAHIPREHMGSIDSRAVKELVEEILEGGRAAFEMRRLKYGF